MNSGEPDAGVTERLRRFEDTRDSRVLWPGLTEMAAAAANAAVERAVRAVLANDPHATLAGEGSGALYALTIAGYTTGTGPMIARWIEDGRIRAPDPVRNVFALQLEHGRRRAERMEHGVLPAFDALLDRGITPVAIKGFHLGRCRQYCEEPGVRPMTDVDIVVPPESVTDAEAALTAAGFLPVAPAARPYKRNWRATNIDPRIFSLERSDARSRWQVELHVTFDRPFPNGLSARLDGERHTVVPFEVAGRKLLAPAQPLLFLLLASHSSSELGALRLLRLIDLVRVVRADRASGRLDWDEVETRLQRSSALRFTYPAIALAESLAPGTFDARLLESAYTASTWGVRHTVKNLVPGGTSSRASLIAMFMWDPSPFAIVRSAVAKVVRSALGRGAGIAEWREAFRRLTSRTFGLAPPDERRNGGGPD